MEFFDTEAHLSGEDSGDEGELQCLEELERENIQPDIVEEDESDEEIVPAKRTRPNNPFAEELLQDLQNGNDLAFMENRYGKSTVENWMCPNPDCKWVQHVRTAGAFEIDGTVFTLQEDEVKKCEICGSEEDFVEPPNLLRE